MTPKEQIQLEEQYLRAKYEYYIIGLPKMLDSDFDKLELKLKNINSKVVNLVDFPTIKQIEELKLNPNNIVDFTKKQDKKVKHLTSYLSLEKIQVEDETNLPLSEINNFLIRNKTAEGFEATLKYDGNGMELVYENGILIKALTRGDKEEGIDKLDKIKHIVPNTISIKELTQIRGEIVINKKLWEDKYYIIKPGEVSNPRNFVAGVLNNENYSIKEIQDLRFIAYDLTLFQNGIPNYMDNTMDILYNLGFNNKYTPTVTKFKNISNFKDLYFKMKEEKENSQFLIDGIVIKYPEKLRKSLGFTNHHPKHSIAIKFLTEEVSTTIVDIEWKMGKNAEYTPVAILEPVELNGTIVRRCSLHNIGYIIDNKAFPGAKISIAKKGEIIPQLQNILEVSPNWEEYMVQFNSFKR